MKCSQINKRKSGFSCVTFLSKPSGVVHQIRSYLERNKNRYMKIKTKIINEIEQKETPWPHQTHSFSKYPEKQQRKLIFHHQSNQPIIIFVSKLFIWSLYRSKQRTKRNLKQPLINYKIFLIFYSDADEDDDFRDNISRTWTRKKKLI